MTGKPTQDEAGETERHTGHAGRADSDCTHQPESQDVKCDGDEPGGDRHKLAEREIHNPRGFVDHDKGERDERVHRSR